MTDKMRLFMVSVCIGLSLAAPQGYNYQIDVGISNTNSISELPNQYQTFQQYSPQLQGQQQHPQSVYQNQFIGQVPQLEQNGFQFNNPQQPSQYDQQHQQQQQQLPTVQQQQQFQQFLTPPTQVVEAPQHHIVEPTESFDNQPQFVIKHRNQPQAAQIAQPSVVFKKEFYYLSAPQEEYETPKELSEQINAIKKNLRVVFIKAPENNGVEKAALKLAQQSINEQTAIYVLTKQNDPSDLTKKLQTIKSSIQQRPEVIFIKYRTPEEAEHAQRVIQAEYEALDGPNIINKPNTAVAHDFVGSTGATVAERRKSNAAVGTAAKSEKIGTSKPVSKYLPASAKH